MKKRFANDNPFQPWNDPMLKDDPFAPWNGPFADSPFEPWNSPLGDHCEIRDKKYRRWLDRYGYKCRCDDEN